MTIYLVKDGIKNVGCIIDNNNKQVINTNFYLITYDFKSNEGYIELKNKNHWRLYTQVGQKLGESRYHICESFKDCVKKMKLLKGDNDVIVCLFSIIEKY